MLVAVAVAFNLHSEGEAALTSRIRERLDAPLISQAVAIELHLLDSGFDGPLGEQRSDFLGGRSVPSRTFAGESFVRGTRGNKCSPGEIVDDLRVHMLERTIDGKARATRRAEYSTSPDSLFPSYSTNGSICCFTHDSPSLSGSEKVR